MVLKNQDIRKAIKSAGLRMWQVAAEYGINDGNFSRLLRHALPEDRKARILDIIVKLTVEDN